MKYLIEIGIRDDHPLFHRKHIDGKAAMKEIIEQRLAGLEGIEIKVTVKKQEGKK